MCSVHYGGPDGVVSFPELDLLIEESKTGAVSEEFYLLLDSEIQDN